jgi:GMP synthase-like glutamine amidotransferase
LASVTRPKPLLLIDCYVDDPGAEATFAPLVDGPLVTVRPTRGPWQADLDDISGVLISGSAASIVEPPPWVAGVEELACRAVDRELPMLGVCFGHQVIVRALYGARTVRRAATPELGWIDIDRHDHDPLFEGVDERFRVFASHVEEICNLPDDVTVLASSTDCAVQAYHLAERPAWGVQFHSEMTLHEATALVHDKSRRYPERGIDAEALLARAIDHTGLARTILDNFLARL